MVHESAKLKKRKQAIRNKSKKNSTTKKRKGDDTIFTKIEYASGDGMLTSVWGPSMWHSLHTISFNYPVYPNRTQKKYYKRFMETLKYTLPCRHCRENFTINLKKRPITMRVMKDRESFSRYVYELHENINHLLNKTSGLSYEQVRERYEHFRARCAKTIPIARKTRKKHKGCTIPLHKFKSKGIIKIVPSETKCNSIEIDEKCNIVNFNGS